MRYKSNYGPLAFFIFMLILFSNCKKNDVAPPRILTDSTCRLLNSNSLNGFAMTYSYNSNNLLSSYTGTFPSGSTTVEFTYDAQGRVTKTIGTTTTTYTPTTSPSTTYYIMDSSGKLVCKKSYSGNQLSDSTVFYQVGNSYITELYVLNGSIFSKPFLYLSTKNEYLYNGKNLVNSIEKHFDSSGLLKDSTYSSNSGYDNKLNPGYKITLLYGYPELVYYWGFSQNNNTTVNSVSYNYRKTGLEVTNLTKTVTYSYNQSGSVSQMQDQATKYSTYFGYDNCD